MTARTLNAAQHIFNRPSTTPSLPFPTFRATQFPGLPQPTEAEKRAGRRQLWLGGFCCGTALAIASNFQQAGITAGTDAGKAGFLTALYVVLVPVFGLFFRRRVSLPESVPGPAVLPGDFRPGLRTPRLPETLLYDLDGKLITPSAP